tara:strand:+ start:95 stop:1093 length:999 start_codon:yes stop_codon:yes gene_type:complete
MRFALIEDSVAIKSYYIKDDTAYGYHDDKPYSYHHGFSPKCFLAMFNLPFLFEFGCHINWMDWETLPDMNLDFIIYDKGKIGLDDDKYDKYHTDILRSKYPNVKILGWIKEVNVANEMRLKNRVRFLNECDAIITSGISEKFKNIEMFKYIRSVVDKKFYFISQPVNINYLFDNFYNEEKEKAIYAYLPNPLYRRGRTYEFADYIGKKYDIEVRKKPVESFEYLGQREFIELWSNCAFHFNLDPSDIHPGNQIMQTAAVGCLNIGGLNESHSILYPDTATCDEKVLEEVVVQYLNDDNKRFEAISFAWEKLNEIYSFKSVEKQINDIYEELS